MTSRLSQRSVPMANHPPRWVSSSLIHLRSITPKPFFNASQKLFVPPLFTAQPIRLVSTSSCRYGSQVTVYVPSMAESISEGILNQFNKKVGDYVEQDEEIATIETDKIDVAVNAPEAGIVQQLFASEGDSVNVGQAIAQITLGSGQLSSAEDQKSQVEAPQNETKESVREPPANEAAPPAENRLFEAPAKPTKSPESSAAPVTGTSSGFVAPQQQLQQFPGYQGSRGEERVKMTRIRKRTSERLKDSQNTTAFLTTFNEVDMSCLIDLRKKHKEEVLEQHGVKMGFMGPIARASVLALHKIPAINASIENEDTIVYRDYIDLSVAVATPKGLVTPVLRNIESLNIIEIERGIAALGKKARDGKLTMADMVGGSFTISNSGVWGSLFGTPIINMPQTAVLGIYGIQDRPMVVNGKIEIRPMMYTALTYDHRLIDGREAVTFLTLIKKYLEDPGSMLLA